MAETIHPKTAATVFLNDRLVPADDARLPALHSGVLNGIGFYETFRTSGGRPHLWAYHWARLEQACARVGAALPGESVARDLGRLSRVIQQMLRDAGESDAVFRYTVFAGVAERRDQKGERAAELIAMRPLPAPPPGGGVCLRVLGVPRDAGEWIPRPKTINQLNARLGADELHRRATDPSDEGLFLSRDEGFVVETTRQNIAWLCDGTLCYPEPAVGSIAGTGLAWVLDRGAPAKACRARLDELAKADAVVVVNSVRGLTPVREIRDARDRMLVSALDSFENPLVVSLRQQWSEALEATARATE